MGLDMYLYAEKHNFVSSTYPEDLKDLVKHTPYKSTTERYLIGHWRKANAIHEWIVENCAGGVDACQDIPMGQEEIIRLRNACMRVMANPDAAHETLPTSDGFFFGSAEYDDWYREQLKYTVNLLNDVIHLLAMDKSDGWGIVYSASW